MPINPEQLEAFVKHISEDERFDIIIERMSLRYWDSFRKSVSIRDRELISARQDVLEDFAGELTAIMNESHFSNVGDNK